MSSTSLFTQSATYFVSNTWVLPANTATVPPKSWWVNAGNSDQGAADQTGNAVMVNSDGKLIVPYSGRFDVNAWLVATDFPSFTSGTMTVTILYTPKNTTSQQYSYIMASGQLVAGSSTPLKLENRVFANSPDEITISFNPSVAVNQTMSPSVQSNVMISDVTNDSTNLQFYGVAGKPPTYANLASTFQNQTATVTNGVANFILTQSGEATGASLFKQITGIWITAQAPASLTGSVGTPTVGLDPIPTNMKTATAHVAVAGAVPTAGWTCLAKIEGY
jgi:hypothetical protein